MSTQKHTPEPWHVSAPRAGTAHGWEVRTYSGEKLAGVKLTNLVCQMSHHPRKQEEAHANAARIVACVNACEGINPEAVPKMLEALRECITDAGAHSINKGTISDLGRRLAAINEIARAAIAAATKEG